LKTWHFLLSNGRRDPFAVPEQAIQAFERLSDTRVSVHDLVGTLTPFLPPERFRHVHPLCAAVKVHHSESCIDFGIRRLRREISSQPEGRVQVCFAGLVEFVVPVFQKRQLEWVFFAGPRTPGRKLRNAVRDTNTLPKPSPWPAGTAMPPPIDDPEAQVILENLRQLAARLRVWSGEMQSSGISREAARIESSRPYTDDLATRRAQIRNFIFTRHTHPAHLADLAELLHLSESRAGHAVKESCGQTFSKLINEARLRTASGLLQHTSLSVLEVALRSGFEEISHFHRCFRARFKTTPLQYRKQSESTFTAETQRRREKAD
jgi:AraC-like DNA-binding protein